MLKKILISHDIYLSGLLFTLLFVGLTTLFSTTRGTGAENESLFVKQCFFVFSGLIFYFISSFIPLDWLKYKKINIVGYGSLVFILVAVLLFAAKVKGATRWFVLPLPIIGSINIQPADIAKLGVIVLGSYILTQGSNKKFKKEIVYVLSMGFILGLILIQPALGTTLISLFCLIFMYYFSIKDKTKFISFFLTFLIIIFSWIIFRNLNIVFRISLSFLFVLIMTFLFFKKQRKIFVLGFFILVTLFTFLLARPQSINYLGEYQKDRVACWLAPESDPTGNCFQQIQAKIAIGSGELFGRGFSQGLQVKRDNLPEFQNDFIYAAFAEQYGFIGTVILLILFFLFLLEIFRISNSQKSEYARIIILGIGIMFLLQIFINISMNEDFLPTTGISLPFLSYGGSFMWISLIAVGLVQNLSHNLVLPDESQEKYERWNEF